MYRKKIFIILVLLSGYLFAGETVLTMKELPENSITVRGFVLKKETPLRIEALGAGEYIPRNKLKNNFLDPSGMFAYAWIIRSDDRQVVWSMNVENTSKAGSGFLRKFEGTIKLPAGTYELYYSTISPPFIFQKGFFSFGDIIDYFFEGKSWYKEGLKKWYVSLQSVDDVLPEKDVLIRIEAKKKEALVSFTNNNANDFKEFRFEVAKDMPVVIYAIGEGFDGKMYDFGRISRLTDQSVVWEMREWNSGHAGGAKKNRLIRKQLTLTKGKYVVQQYMDDSHHPGDWNANPPFDPFFYGITIWPVNNSDLKFIKKIEDRQIKPLIEMTRVGDNAYLEKEFVVRQTARVRIVALGEGKAGKMYDYAYLEDAETKTRVWEMTYDETRHAGGSSKNRMVDMEMVLGPGRYKLIYVSDDSHSYGSWNESMPYNPSLWGVTLYPLDSGAVEIINGGQAETGGNGWDIQLTGAKDDEHLFKKFTLTKLSKITIYALGEGDDGEMYDYAWIENVKTGKIEWKMLYENTEWAGGARKNRKIIKDIYLPPGTYLLHYKTDDSHSSEGWNDSPPSDAKNYGVSIKISEVE